MNAHKFDYSKVDKVAGDNAGTTKLQDAAIRAATNARTVIQYALVATLLHLAKHHDVRMASRLVDGLNGTVRGNALVRYLLRYGHLEVGRVEVEGKDGKTTKVDGFIGIVGDAKDHEAAIRKTLDEAKNTAWYELTPPANPYSFKLENALMQVERQAEAAAKRVKNGKAKPEDVDFHVSDAVREQVMRLFNFEQIVEETLAEAGAEDNEAKAGAKAGKGSRKAASVH